MEPEFRTIEAHPTAAIRATCTPARIGETLSELYPEIAAVLSDRDIAPTAPPYARYHSFTDEGVDIEAGIEVAAPFEDAGRVRGSELPGGRMAVFLHTGPYDQLGETYAEINAWVESSDEQALPGSWELYVDDPSTTAPAQLRTEIFVPLG